MVALSEPVREGDGKVRKLFVQCKHYMDSGNLSPDVAKELKGSVDLDEIDSEDYDIEMMIISQLDIHSKLSRQEKLILN